jgi:hypothetical protein
VVVIEPHTGIVARLFGTQWEHHEEEVNYVFRFLPGLGNTMIGVVIKDASHQVGGRVAPRKS